MMVRGMLTKKHPPPFMRKLRTMGKVCGEIGVARTSTYIYDGLKHSNEVTVSMLPFSPEETFL